MNTLRVQVERSKGRVGGGWRVVRWQVEARREEGEERCVESVDGSVLHGVARDRTDGRVHAVERRLSPDVAHIACTDI